MRILRKEAVITAPLSDLWKTWTTLDGVVSFFAPKANIDLRPDGPFELFFEPDAPVGFQGTEGCKILEVHPESSFSFEFIAPPHFPNVRRIKTQVRVDFSEVQKDALRKVSLTHSGFLGGEEWDSAFEFFHWSWDLVLARFQRRFSVGPIDWKKPYRPDWLRPFPERRIRDHVPARV